MNGRGLKRMTLVIAICALVGAVAGIAGSAAAPSSSSSAKAQAAKTKQLTRARLRALRRGFKGGLRMGFGFGPGPGEGFGAVHAEAVVPKPDGSGFITITTDSGTLNSAADGTTLHLKEGTDKATYKDDVAIDVGSAATVIRDGAKATLADLKQGDHVRVIQGGPKGTFVLAADDAFIQQQQNHDGWGRHAFGPGPPPPGAPGDYPGDNGGSNQNGSTTGQSGSPSNS